MLYEGGVESEGDEFLLLAEGLEVGGVGRAVDWLEDVVYEQ